MLIKVICNVEIKIWMARSKGGAKTGSGGGMLAPPRPPAALIPTSLYHGKCQRPLDRKDEKLDRYYGTTKYPAVHHEPQQWFMSTNLLCKPNLSSVSKY